MLKLKGLLVCLLIVALDVAAGILGIQAEVAQNKCRDPSHEAFKLALGAVILLSLAHVLTNLLGGCMCVCSQEEFQRASPNRQLSLACLVFTWIILAVGLSTLVIGMVSNNKPRASCGFTHHHFLSIGGILCFVHGLFSAAYYVSSTAATDRH
ncbi:hypothetical protein F3Y22_tig00113721pilonHSYRG00002 [Hibiscus syriacus]|uniref:Uncharacterized protein n=1 Tax=Hibiscus syriacus TaxID=106335 RepID=A0A6A2WN87_HIBSY|nr:hypothetical protein F3Y22_tig00113721pilonHSYRG00002 [Hibiscus syriacus]